MIDSIEQIKEEIKFNLAQMGNLNIENKILQDKLHNLILALAIPDNIIFLTQEQE